jgi:pSer/pThr/pTyr-binding forkhead associated (FHA) protein
MATDGPVYQIAIVDDEGQVTTVPMIRDEFTIGRKEGNVIRLTERNVSRNHARIARENGRFFLSDQGSYNGTRLNGRRVRGKMPLSPGDEVGIGDYTLRVEVLEGAAVAAAPAAAAEPVRPPQITVVVEGKPNTVYILSDVPHVIGRGDECTIRVDEPGVSRTHARMHLLQGRYFVEDAGSANGLLVAGQRVRSKALDPGDVIEVGRVQLYFTLGGLKAEDIKTRSAAAGGRSRLPMIFGSVLALIAVIGVVYVLFLRNKGDEKGADASAPVAQADAGLPTPADDDGAGVALVIPGADAGGVTPPETAADTLVATTEEAGVPPEQLLARAREAAAQAATVPAWDAVLELLAATELSADATAAELRASATRERDARQALDQAKQAMGAGDPATASKRLAAVPPDVRCAAEAAPMWNDVIVAGRDAARAQRLEDLQTIVEALRQIVAPPPRVARGRDELEASLRRLESQTAPPPADAGTPRRDAGGTTAADARVRTDAGAAPPRDAGGTTPPPTDNSYDEARQMVLAGDNQGCIDVLSRAPQSSRNLELLITCYKAAGRMPDAHNAMLSYVSRYPTARKADEYRQVLQAAGRLP